MKKSKRITFFRSLLWAAIVILIITMFVAAFFRFQNMADALQSGSFPDEDSIDYGYAVNPLLSIIHILPGLVFLCLGALQFVQPFRNRFIKIHRLSGKIYLFLGAVIGITAIMMGFKLQYGGMTETAAVTIFGLYFLLALSKAFMHIKKGEQGLHREWMIRAYSIGIAVATMRPIIGLFLGFTHIAFAGFFGWVFWLAFILHAIVAELWIRYTRVQVQVTL